MENSKSKNEDEYSVFVLASDLGIDARPFLSNQERQEQEKESSELTAEDLSDLDSMHFFRIQGFDRAGNRIVRVVGNYFPAPVVSGERLKKYIMHKLCSELLDERFCVVYMHSMVQKEDNSPGITILRWIYEDLPTECKDRLQAMYLIHPGLQLRLVFATFGRFFLSGGLYWKINYVSRLQYLWEDIKKGEIEIPDFVQSHDDILEHRPLTDYGIEPDPLRLDVHPTTAYPFGRYED